MTSINYDLILELLGYADVDEDFSINYEKEINIIVRKLDLLDEMCAVVENIEKNINTMIKMKGIIDKK